MSIRRQGLRVGQAETFRARLYSPLSPCIVTRLPRAARARGWSFMVHRTDRPATGGASRPAVLSSMPVRAARRRIAADVRPSARLHFSFRPRRARGPAAIVFPAAHHAAAPGAGAVSAAAAHSRSSLRGTKPPRARLGGCCCCVLSIAACLIFAMAGPVLESACRGDASGTGLCSIVMDDGWPAAPSWERRIAAASRRIEAAGRNSQPVAVAVASGRRRARSADSMRPRR